VAALALEILVGSTAFALEACAAPPPPPPIAELGGTSWRVMVVNGRQTPANGDYSMRFETNGQMGARFGCNAMGGRYRMVGGTLTHPRVALDAAGRKQSDFYHSWTWWRFLAELVPDQQGSGMPVIIRDVWERVDATDRDADVDSLRATVAAVRAVGRGFAATVAAYGEAKRHPADAFEEGASWPTVPLIDTYRVRAGSRTAWKSAALPHLTSQTFSFRPGSGTADPRWRLRIPVDAPSRVTGSHAQVTEVHADGHRVVRRIPLDRRGVGRIVTPFSSTVVSRIELTITNASTRYSCWHGSYLACRGRPLDDGRRTSFRGVTVKR